MKKVTLVSLLVLILVVLPYSVACSTTPTTQPAASATQPATQAKTLKIGVVSWFGFFVGIDMVHGIELMVSMDNANGGIDIGGEKYKIELVKYDSNNTQATEVAAINRLVYEDNVNIILASPGYASSWLPITEQNKVLVFAYSPDFRSILDPKYHYVFSANYMNNIAPIFAGWFSKTYPDLTRSIVVPAPDNQFGHGNGDKEAAAWQTFSVTPSFMYYPATQTDLSAVATKVINQKPTAVYPLGMDMSILKALYQGGYKGQIFADNTAPVGTLTKVVPIEALEGYIGAAWPFEFDPVPSAEQQAREFKAAWTIRYNSWEGPEVVDIGNYACLKAALQQAGSADTGKLADLIAKGLKFDSPTGAGQMISRPDLGIDRAVDSITAMNIKQVKQGKPVLIATIPLDEAMNSCKMAYTAK
jgi:branched-chain amino acid transport system substrate-binding protein